MEQKVPVEKIKRAIEERNGKAKRSDEANNFKPFRQLRTRKEARKILEGMVDRLDEFQTIAFYELRMDLKMCQPNLDLMGDLLNETLQELLPGLSDVEDEISDALILEPKKQWEFTDYLCPLRDVLVAAAMLIGAKAAGASDEKLKAMAGRLGDVFVWVKESDLG